MKLTENKSKNKLKVAQSYNQLSSADGRDDAEHHVKDKSKYHKNWRVGNLDGKPRKDEWKLDNVKNVEKEVKQQKRGQTEVANGIGGHDDAARQILLNFIVITFFVLS